MALEPLASITDLSARSEDAAADVNATTALNVASAAIRDAADSPISQATGTVTVVGSPSSTLTVGLLRNVTAVTIDGEAVTDYKATGTGLWRPGGWGNYSEVAITGTFGLPTVPEDIVDMCCQLAIAWVNHSSSGGGSTAGLTMVAIDDAREGYTDEAAGQVSPVFIPEATRAWLRSRFSGGVSVVETA